MPAWIHDRAKHLQRKNPSMPEGEAWAIATQQAHKVGKTPKNYGTPEGRREAKAKYDNPESDYLKSATHHVKKAALLVAMEKAAQQGMMMQATAAGTPLAPSTPMGGQRLGGIQSPVPAPPVRIAPAQTPALPTATSGPGAMLKTSSDMYRAFFDELALIMTS